MEHLAIPGGGADLVIARLLARRVADAVDLVGFANAVAAAAFRHWLTKRDDALAELRSAAAIAASDNIGAGGADDGKRQDDA